MSHAPPGSPLRPPIRLAPRCGPRRQRWPHLHGEPGCRRRRASAGRGEILTAAFAGWAAGAMSMAAGEFVSVSSQADLEAADLEREKRALKEEPTEELAELAKIYEARGLDADLARKVAEQLTARDALSAHARDELGLAEDAG